MNTIKKILRSFKINSQLNFINIFSMTLGIAVSIIIAGFVYQEFNYDMQLPNSNRIFKVYSENENNEINCCASYAPLAEGLKNDFPEIENAARVSLYYGYLALTAGENMFNESSAIFADPDFFNMFSFPMIEGNPAKCLDLPNSIILSESASKKYFGDNSALGKQIKIGKDKVFTVSGIYKDFSRNSNFQGDIILPFEVTSKLTQVWIEPSWKYESDIHTFIMLDDNTNSEVLAEKIKDYQITNVEDEPKQLFLQPLKSIHTEKEIFWESTQQANKSYLHFLTAVAAIILTMSALNFLLLYIGTASQKVLNTGIKKFCGATKSIIFREHIKEVLAYITISTLASVVLIYLYNSFLIFHFSFLPGITQFDSNLVVFLLILIVSYSIFISTIPAFSIARQNPEKIFKTHQQSLIGRSNILNMLVTGQFTLSVILLAVTALFYKQIDFLEKHDPGYAKEELITIPLNMHIGDGIYNENIDVFAEELKNQVGVKNVTLAFSSPVNIQTSTENFEWDGKSEGTYVPIQWNAVFFDYFETLGLKMLQGRSFNRDFPSDMLNDSKCSYILNQQAVEEMGIEDPIGKNFSAYVNHGPIIGIVEDFNFKSLHSEIDPMCFTLNPFYYNEIIVRINPQVDNVLSNVETVWKNFVPDYPLEFSFITDQLDKMYKSENNLTSSLNAFSAIAILIACMGLLALTILSMQRRTKEIGIRKVNGAKAQELLTMLNVGFVKSVVISLVIAGPIAWYIMNKWLQNFAYKTEISWWIFALAGLTTLTIALVTVSWQSWRAASRNPVEALRYE